MQKNDLFDKLIEEYAKRKKEINSDKMCDKIYNLTENINNIINIYYEMPNIESYN